MSLHSKAQNLFEAKKFQEALLVYDEAIRNDPDQPDLLHDRAVCLFHIGNLDDALKDMNRAKDLQPDYGYRYASRAFIKSAMKDINGAIEDYRKAVELDPEDAISFNNLGLLEEKLGYMDLAQQRFEKADGLAGLLRDTGVSSSSESTPINLQRSIDEEKKEEAKVNIQEISREAFSVFRSKSQFKEYLNFLRKSFKKKQ